MIRLAPAGPGPEAGSEAPPLASSRRGFDYESFAARIESLWFQRKALQASGRDADAEAQLAKIEGVCSEEGVRRLESYAAALLSEAGRDLARGDYAHALAALRFAERFDPDRPQVNLALALAHWRSHAGLWTTAHDAATALRKSLARAARDLSLFHRLAAALLLSLAASAALFCVLMLLRHGAALRHEVEEGVARAGGGVLARPAGWAALLLPLGSWVAAGWAPFYWLLATFRYMGRSERLAAVGILLLALLAVPAHGVLVGLYGTTADPVVRTTVASLDGEYDPDRIVRLRELVEMHPEDASYHFLLGGLYRNGQYFEEAFDEYKRALQLQPTFIPALINLANIFYATGQYGEAIAGYKRVLALEPDSFLAHFNLHLAQSGAFSFSAAEESLHHAYEIDSARVSRLLSQGERPMVQEARLAIPWVWGAAEASWDATGRESARAVPLFDQLEHPLSFVAALTLLSCLVSSFAFRRTDPARRCIRCGNAFCRRCKRRPEAREYCTQCLHLFILREGLSGESKTRKTYEVERFERRGRRTRRLLSALAPGADLVLRGRTMGGLGVILAWSLSIVLWLPLLLGGREGLESLRELLSGPAGIPVRLDLEPVGLLGVCLSAAVWLAAQAWPRGQRREA